MGSKNWKRHAGWWLGLIVTASAAGGALADPKPGFYPGGAEPYMPDTDKEAYSAFLEHNKDKIAQVTSLIDEIKADPSKGGCIGKDTFTCIASLAQVYAVGSGFSANPAAHFENAPFDDADVDVNGRLQKSKDVTLVLLSGPTGFEGDRMASLSYNDGGLIKYVEIFLPGNPVQAHTEAEYRLTKIYETAKTVLPPSCDLSDEMSFYRFIENQVKVGLQSQHDTEFNDFAVTNSHSRSGSAPFCGVVVGISADASNSTDKMTVDNPQGVSVSYSLIVKMTP